MRGAIYVGVMVILCVTASTVGRARGGETDPAAAPDSAAAHAARAGTDHAAMHHDMSSMGMAMDDHAMPGAYGPYPMTREASGTSWQPDAARHSGLHVMRGEWMLMFHGYADAVLDDQRGPRGDQQVMSDNMAMGMARRPLGPGTLGLRAMLSLEPATIGRDGYPLLLQTGETANGVTPLIDRQHPHDLFMELAGSWSVTSGSYSAFVYAGLPGEPALGPPAFMHRFSGSNLPAAPITHHWLDSTHISYGVLTGGVETGGLTIEASAFRGEEPDENRYNIEAPKLDSYSARLGWQRGPWSGQVSAGHLHVPEWFEPYDETRITASIGYDGLVRAHPVSALLAWGENRDAVVINGVSDNFLLEWNLAATERTSLYGRGEVVEKEILGLGYHPLGFQHPHVYSHIDALTLGLVRDVVNGLNGRFGFGGDATLYHMSPDLLPFWQGSHSYHVFLRWRPNVSAHHHH